MKKWSLLLLLALSLRLGLILTTLHPDIRAYNLAGYLISQKSMLFGFYDYISQLPRSDHLVQLYGDGLFIYPPLAYWLHGFFFKVLNPIYPWPEFWQLVNDMGSLNSGLNKMWLLFLLKLPYLLGDLLLGVVLIKMVEDKQKFKAFLIWAFNPVIIYSASMMGQFDVYVALFVLLSLWANRQKKFALAGLMLGLAAGFKPFPLIVLPFVGKTWKDKLMATVSGCLAYFLIILPYLKSSGFINYALLAGQSDKLWQARIAVSSTQYISLFVVLWLVFVMLNFFKRDVFKDWQRYFVVFGIFYSLTHFHPQWFTWGMGVLMYGVVLNPNLFIPYILTILCWLSIVLSFDHSLHFGLFGLKFEPFALLPKIINREYVVSLLRSLFVGSLVSLFVIENRNDEIKN